MSSRLFLVVLVAVALAALAVNFGESGAPYMGPCLELGHVHLSGSCP